MEQDWYPGDEFAARLVTAIGTDYSIHNKAQALALYDRLADSNEAKKRLREWAEQDYGDDYLERRRRALLPALLLMQERHASIPRHWTQIFSRSLATEDVERTVEVRGPGLPQVRPRGAATTRDNAPGERFVYYLEPRDIALSTAIKRDADPGWMDFAEVNEHGERGRTDLISVVVPLMFGMAESFVQAEEIIHANLIDTGRVYNAAIGGDGVPLFAEHPIDTSTYSNRGEFDLQELALEHISALIKVLPLQNGNRAMPRARKLVVPIPHEFRAARLIKAIHEVDPSLYPEGYCVLDFLNDPTAWYVLTTIKGLVSMEKTPFKLDLRVEDDNLVLEGSHSYGCGYKNPRAIFGCFPD